MESDLTEKKKHFSIGNKQTKNTDQDAGSKNATLEYTSPKAGPGTVKVSPIKMLAGPDPN